MAIAQSAGSVAAPSSYEVRKISSADVRESLAQGWDDFLEHRGDLIFVGILYPLIGLFAAVVAFQGPWLPLFVPVAAGVSLLGPVAAIGFYELARRREAGLESDWSHFFDVAKRPAWESILGVAALLVIIFALWVVAAGALYTVLIGPAPTSVRGFLWTVFTTPQGWALIVVGNLIGLCFAALVLTISVVSMPFLVDHDVDARTAIETSVKAVMANKGVMIMWGLIVATLLVIGSIPAFLGLAVVLPVLGYATWHLYMHLVVH
ncbi:DUF2189 domain-containing protein [Sphingomonas tabacisoli]|uniref:DUF2189 domain-containing protein n=1 Tax=Sphingomonas tabacisoli TaxID=2249466 RepID=A0ABW4I218_9SPHN